MKKPKVSLDLDQIKQFGIEHGEKLALAAAVVILGIFIVKAVGHETLESLPGNLSPQSISDKSNSATSYITGPNNAKPPAEQDVVGVDKGVNFVDRIDKQPTQVAPKLAKSIEPIEEEPFPDPVTRADPTLFPVEELRGEAFRGAIPTTSEGMAFIHAPAAEPAPVAAATPPTNPAPAPAAGGLFPQRPGRFTRNPRGGQFGRPGQPAPVGGLLPTNPTVTTTTATQQAQQYPSGLPGPMGTGAAEAHYGIVVTGLIPVSKQLEEYEYRFKNARRSSTDTGQTAGIQHEGNDADTPKYAWCLLERIDTTTGTKISMNFGDRAFIDDYKSDVQELRDSTRTIVKENGIINENGDPSLMKIMQQQQQWGGAGSTEVVEKEFLDTVFSLKLPPVLLRNWGPEAAHLPQIPLAGAPATGGLASASSATPAPGGFLSSNGVQPPIGFGTTGAAQPTKPATVGVSPPGTTSEAAVAYKLLRFVDLDVEPGHVYRYSVKMLLRNPNFGLEPQVLTTPESRSVAYRPTPWSEPSPKIAVEPAARLLAGTIDRPKRQLEKAKIGVFIFDMTQAVELIKQFDTELGALVGTTVGDQTIKNFADPVKRQVHDITANFRTPSVVLDFRGSEDKLPGTSDMMDSSEMLLLDDVDHPENPRLIAINEGRDKPVFDQWAATHTVAVAAPAADATKPGAKAGADLFKPGGGGLLPATPGAARRR